MKNQDETVHVGVFERLDGAQRAVAGLVEAGFPRDAISVVCPTCAEDALAGVEHVDPAGARTPEAVVAGGAIGTVLGALTAVGIVASGGTGLLVVGPLLGGAAFGGVAGGFIGAMTTRGFEPEIADYYDQALERGQILVAVEAEHGGPAADRANEVFVRSGAVPVELSSPD